MLQRRSVSPQRLWTSLSALAGAALTSAPGSAYATIISHGPSAFPIVLPGGNSIDMLRSVSPPSFDTNHLTGIDNLMGQDYFRAQLIQARLVGVTFVTQFSAVGKGQTFNQIPGGRGSVFANWRRETVRVTASARVNAAHPKLSTAVQDVWLRVPRSRNFHFSYFGTPSHETGLKASGSRVITNYSLPAIPDAYALFRFNVGSQIDYGWLELRLSYDSSGPLFSVLGYAYDTSGKPIPAGYTGIPEPTQLPLALSALSLGAIGVREWRKNRNKTAAA